MYIIYKKTCILKVETLTNDDKDSLAIVKMPCSYISYR